MAKIRLIDANALIEKIRGIDALNDDYFTNLIQEEPDAVDRKTAVLELLYSVVSEHTAEIQNAVEALELSYGILIEEDRADSKCGRLLYSTAIEALKGISYRFDDYIDLVDRTVQAIEQEN